MVINNIAIESRRKELKYTNKELAISLGYKNESSIRDKMKGRTKWTAEDIRKISEVLDLPYEVIYK